MEVRELICIGCPMGCNLKVEIKDGEAVSVSGNTCKIGETYAKKEVSNPTRVVTSTLKVDGGTVDMVPVKTESDVPKVKIFDVVRSLKGCTIKAPINVGEVLVENVAGTGVNIISTRSIEAKN